RSDARADAAGNVSSHGNSSDSTPDCTRSQRRRFPVPPAPQSAIEGWLPDQPALHGVLVKVRDLGLTLVSVRRLGPGGQDR
ncbi:MAG: hypothetical protein WAL72_27480, partial [Streptosporangiaceae bacterium]